MLNKKTDSNKKEDLPEEVGLVPAPSCSALDLVTGQLSCIDTV